MMKNLFFLAAVSSLALSTISCKSKKESTSSSTATASASTEPATNDTKPVTYRLIVSFISKGAGTDSPKRTAFLEYIAKHPKKPAYKEMRWGREGEADYGFMLTELDAKKELTAFIEDIKKIADGSDMMVISENTTSLHVR